MDKVVDILAVGLIWWVRACAVVGAYRMLFG